MKITLDTLKSSNFCRNALTWFAAHYPDGVELDELIQADIPEPEWFGSLATKYPRLTFEQRMAILEAGRVAGMKADWFGEVACERKGLTFEQIMAVLKEGLTAGMKADWFNWAARDRWGLTRDQREALKKKAEK